MTNKNSEPKVYKAQDLANILNNYYRKKQGLGKNEKSSEPYVLVHDDSVAELIDQGFRSKVYKVPVKFTYRNAGRSEERDLCICVKKYGGGKITDSTRFQYDRDLCQREAIGLEVLSHHTNCLPDLYGYTRNGGLEIFLEYLGSVVLGRTYGVLHEDDLKVLTEIANNDPILQSKLIKEHKNKYDIIKELIKIGLVASSPSGQTIELGLAPGFDKRFEIKEGKLIEKEEYKKDRLSKFRAGSDALFEFQKVARAHKDDLISRVTLPNLQNIDSSSNLLYIGHLDKTIRKINAILDYREVKEEKVHGKKYFLENEKEFKREYTRDNIEPVSLEIREQKDIVGGDSHALNMMIKNGKVYLTDLFHMAIDHWTVDPVDYITFLKLFCGLEENEVNAFFYNAYSSRLMVNPKENFETYQDMRKRVDLDRAIIAAGSLSGILLNYTDRFSGYEEREMKKRRKAYLRHIHDLLPTKSERGKPLFGGSSIMLEKALFS